MSVGIAIYPPSWCLTIIPGIVGGLREDIRGAESENCFFFPGNFGIAYLQRPRRLAVRVALINAGLWRLSWTTTVT